MFRARSLFICLSFASASLLSTAAFVSPARAEEDHLRAQTRVFNVADERAKAEESAKASTTTTINVGGDAVVNTAPEGSDDVADVMKEYMADEAAKDGASEEVATEVTTTTTVQEKKSPTLTARERIYERIRKNRTGER